MLTWQLMRNGARVYYEPSAVAFTVAPARLVHLARQRARWARGMVEGLRSVKPWNQPRWLLRLLTAIDLLIPALDVADALVWLPVPVPATPGVQPCSASGCGATPWAELLGLRRRWT